LLPFAVTLIPVTLTVTVWFGWVVHPGTVKDGIAVYPLPAFPNVTLETTPLEATLAVPVAPDPPAPLNVRFWLPVVQKLLPLPAPSELLLKVVLESLVLKLNELVLMFVIVVTLPEAEALAPGFAAQALPPHDPLIAFARLVASVLVVKLRTMQKFVVPQLDSQTYVSLPTVMVLPLPGRPVKVAVPTGVVPGAGTDMDETPTVVLAAAPEPPPFENATVGIEV